MVSAEDTYYLNKDQVAQRLGLTRRGVECLMARRVIPTIRISSRCVRFDWKKVQAALEKRELRAV